MERQAGADYGVKALEWFKHPTNQSAGMALLERKYGFDAVGRYWRLVEIAGASEFHSIPQSGHSFNQIAAMALGFETEEELEEFLRRLNSLGLVDLDESGARRFPTLDAAAELIERRRRCGALGGRARADNRRRKAEDDG